MSSIAVVSEYTPVEKALSVHAKNWAVKPKPEPLHVDRHVKGPCRVTFRTERSKSPVIAEFSSPDEMLTEMKKDSIQRNEAGRFPDQDSFTNVEKQSEGGMWSAALTRKVLGLNPRLTIQDSKNAPGCAAFYLRNVDGLKYTNASFRHGWMPQFTIMKENEQRVATEFTYGWRTVLMRLIKCGALTRRQVNKAFGEVQYSDARGKHYALNLEGFSA